MSKQIAKYRELVVVEAENDGYYLYCNGEAVGLGDGVDMLTDGRGQLLRPGTPQFNTEMQAALEDAYPELLGLFHDCQGSLQESV